MCLLLDNKNTGFQEFQYKDTPFTALYKDMVTVKHLMDCLKLLHSEYEEDIKTVFNVVDEEDWDNDNDTCLNNPIHDICNYEIGISNDSGNSDDSGNAGHPKESTMHKLLKNIPIEEPAQLYAHIAFGEYTLIQSHDDLQAAKTLLSNEHFSQSVFMSSQSVEKSLKSLCRLFEVHFTAFIKKHCAVELYGQLSQVMCKIPYNIYCERLQMLCSSFEILGEESWLCSNPLSIRSRYFYFNNDWHSDSRYYYSFESFPGLVYTRELARDAFMICEEIFQMSEEIFLNFNNEM